MLAEEQPVVQSVLQGDGRRHKEGAAPRALMENPRQQLVHLSVNPVRPAEQSPQIQTRAVSVQLGFA
jgi:hypothetical protein